MSDPLSGTLFSKLNVQERWIKLYRKLHNMFLSKEFVHVDDFKLMLEQMNARVTAVEANAATAIAQTNTNITTAIAGHIHQAPQAPAGTLPTTPGQSTAPIPPVPAPTAPPTKFIDAVMKTTDNALKGLGPALAPLGNGLSPEAALATAQAVSDINVGGV